MTRVPDDLAAAVALGGEMGERIARFDWAEHPLGPPEGWPVWMRSMVAVTLASRFPTVLWFGPELFLLYNDAYLPILGDKHPDSLGAAGRVVWAEIWDVIGPMLAGVMDTGVATWSADQRLNIARHGFLEQGFFTFTYSPMFGGTGDVTGVFCVVHETTEKVLGERRLRTLSDLASQLVECHETGAVAETSLAVCASNPLDLRFVALYLVDHGRMSLHSTTEQVANVFAAGAASLDDLLDRPMSHGRSVLLESCDTRMAGLGEALGEPGSVPALVLPLDDSSGGPPLGSIVIGLNSALRIDRPYQSFCELLAGSIGRAFGSARLYELERDRAEALAELDRAKTAFFSNISHEFRTPLTLILSPLEDALEDVESLSLATRERLAIAHANGMRLTKLVNNLLDFSRLEGGRVAPRLARVDAAGLTGDLVSMFQSAFEKAGVTLETELTLTEPLYLDPEMWERIVLNLLSNALKYTLSGTVRVTLRGEAGQGQLTVADTGVGIPGDDHERIFTRFHRVERGGRSIEGSGVGLAIVKELVRMLGGDIAVESEPGVGSTFTVTVPFAGPDKDRPETDVPMMEVAPGGNSELFVAEALQWLDGDATAGRLQRPPATAPGTVDPRLILVIDDNADMRAYLGRVLGQIWKVELAASAKEALAIVSRQRPDLILTDVMMPELDGFELLTRLRRDQDLSEVPVIMVSARAGAEASVEGLEAGAEDYIVKPFTSMDLVRRVRARLEASQRSARSGHGRAQDMLRQALLELTATLAARTSIEQIAEAIFTAVSKSAPLAYVCIGQQGHGEFLDLRFVGSLPASLRTQWQRVSVSSDTPLASAAREQVPLLFASNAELRERFPDLSSDVLSATPGALATLPLVLDAQSVGALAFAWRHPVEFGPSMSEFIESVVELTAHAIERLRMADFERALTQTLQHELLGLPIRSQAAVISARYNPSVEMLGIGGDWYDAFELADGRLGLVVGDVVGHGIESAAVMSQLRSALTVCALQADGPADAIEALDRFASRLPAAGMTTVCYAVIDRERSRLSYCCAGHPPPALVTPDGVVRLLADGRSGPLAKGHTPASRTAASVPFPSGSLLFLYTDGLVERRGESMDRGLERLTETLAAFRHLPVRALTERVLDRQQLEAPIRDDIAIIAARTPVARPGMYTDILPADAHVLAGMRKRLRRWVDGLGRTRDENDDIVLAVCEAATNAIEHGSRNDPGELIAVEGATLDGRLLFAISDNGSWQPNLLAGFRSGRGYGHKLMEALADEMHVTTDRYGTTVNLSTRLQNGEAR